MKELRKSKGITATFMANKLKISRDRFKRIEDCKSMLPVEFIPTLSEIYGIKYDELVERRVKEWKKLKKN